MRRSRRAAPSTVIVENGRIARIEDGATAPAGATVVDMRSKTVMPGLTDVHVHLTATPASPGTRASPRNIRPLCDDARPDPRAGNGARRLHHRPRSWRRYVGGHRRPRRRRRRPLSRARGSRFRATLCRLSAAMATRRPAYRPSWRRRSRRAPQPRRLHRRRAMPGGGARARGGRRRRHQVPRDRRRSRSRGDGP